VSTIFVVFLFHFNFGFEAARAKGFPVFATHALDFGPVDLSSIGPHCAQSRGPWGRNHCGWRQGKGQCDPNMVEYEDNGMKNLLLFSQGKVGVDRFFFKCFSIEPRKF
jgi:hypothetical protein